MRNKRINKFTHVILAFAMLFVMPLVVPALAAETHTDLPAEIAAQRQAYDMKATTDKKEALSKAIAPLGGEGGVNRVIGEYLAVFPIYEKVSDGSLYTFNDTYLVKNGSTSFTFVDMVVSTNTVNQLTNLYLAYGYRLVGWHIEGSIYLDVYRAGQFQYREMDYFGTGALKSKTGQNGSNYFVIQTWTPDTPTQSYTYGIEGTVTHYFADGRSGSHNIALRADFNKTFDNADIIQIPTAS